MIYSTDSGIKVLLCEDGSLIDPLNAVKPLIVRDLNGATLIEVPANGEWTLESVIHRLSEEGICRLVSNAYGAEASIGVSWIGGTEV